MQNGFFNTQPGRGLGLLALALVCLALASYAYASFQQAEYLGEVPASITVDGEGEVLAVPDVGQFSFSVRAEGDTAEIAQEESGTKINAILAYLKEVGIEEKDIKTQNYSLYPRWEYIEQICVFGRSCPPMEQIQNGFEVSQTVSVKVRDTNKAGEVISGVGERGATDISGLSFTIDDMDALKSEARAKAITDAKAKAEVLADQLGVKITRLISYYENGADYSYEEQAFARSVSLDAEDGSFGGPELPVGEESTKSNVSLTFEIE